MQKGNCNHFFDVVFYKKVDINLVKKTTNTKRIHRSFYN